MRWIVDIYYSLNLLERRCVFYFINYLTRDARGYEEQEKVYWWWLWLVTWVVFINLLDCGDMGHTIFNCLTKSLDISYLLHLADKLQ